MGVDDVETLAAIADGDPVAVAAFIGLPGDEAVAGSYFGPHEGSNEAVAGDGDLCALR